MSNLSRRGLLKSVMQGAPLAGAQFIGVRLQDPNPIMANGPITHWNAAPKGRVLLNLLTEYKEPSWRAPATGTTYLYDDVVDIVGVVAGEGLYTTNHTWLETDSGYIYSSWVQPVEDIRTNPVESIGLGGAWTEVTVPMTRTYAQPEDSSPRQRLYYSNVQRVIGQENGFYYVEEIYGMQYWVKANEVRVIPPSELAPISADVPAAEKRFEISLLDQRAYAYEGGQIVRDIQVATGTLETPTPIGEWQVIIKRIGQRMTGGASDTFYNLPGIPYVSYINRMWIATHGCYWHNDYGRLHSAGCVNMLPADAKWVFRWTTPHANYFSLSTDAGEEGTPVSVRI